MATRSTLTRADTMFSQSAYYPRANALPGLPISPTNYFSFGVVAAAAANAIALSQASAGGNNALTLNGALATAGIATIPTPRNVVAAWTTAAVITVTGTDFYGAPQTETAASGTAFTGNKAFATVTAVTFSVAVTAATVGTGVKLGLPYRVGVNGILDALTDSLPDVTYTLVVGDSTSPATSSTGDVRGTIAASAAPNGAHNYAVNLVVFDRTGGTDKQSGAYGVTPA